jgi:hypothetical protein|tara:strand:+ start:943 stop:1128 length:186 start_codon:yes stop_codon:yes gene_type:complete
MALASKKQALLMSRLSLAQNHQNYSLVQFSFIHYFRKFAICLLENFHAALENKGLEIFFHR